MPSMKILPMVAAVLAAFQVSAYSLSLGVGPKGGLNMAGAAVEDEPDNQDRRMGVAAGLQAEFGVTNPYSLLVEPMYLQRGARFDVPISDSDAEVDMNYLEVPVLLKAKFGKTAAHAYLFAGPSLGFLLGSEGAWEGFETELEDNFTGFNLAGDIGVGGAYQVSEFVYVSADARYSHGFLNAVEDDIGTVDSWMTRDIRLMAGLLFHLTQ